MDINKELYDLVKKQAEYFLLDAGEFYPFGTWIKFSGELAPFSVYTGEEFPASQELIDEYEKVLTEHSDYIEAVVTVDSLIRYESREPDDALQLRVFRDHTQVAVYTVKYVIGDGVVNFYE